MRPTFGHSRAATAYGDAGTDWLQGNDRNDVLIGGTGNDTLTGSGDDTLSGEAGDDHLDGDAGHDFLVGGRGNDTLYGHAGNDLLYGLDGGDVLDGGDGNDVLDAGVIDSGMSNTLFGGPGEDVLFSSVYGADALYGGGNDDRFVIRISSVYADPVLVGVRVNQVVEDGQPGDVASLGGVYSPGRHRHGARHLGIGGAAGEGFRESNDPVGEFVWAVGGAGFPSPMLPALPRLRQAVLL